MADKQAVAALAAAIKNLQSAVDNLEGSENSGTPGTTPSAAADDAAAAKAKRRKADDIQNLKEEIKLQAGVWQTEEAMDIMYELSQNYQRGN